MFIGYKCFTWAPFGDSDDFEMIAEKFSVLIQHLIIRRGLVLGSVLMPSTHADCLPDHLGDLGLKIFPHRRSDGLRVAGIRRLFYFPCMAATSSTNVYKGRLKHFR